MNVTLVVVGFNGNELEGLRGVQEMFREHKPALLHAKTHNVDIRSIVSRLTRDKLTLHEASTYAPFVPTFFVKDCVSYKQMCTAMIESSPVAIYAVEGEEKAVELYLRGFTDEMLQVFDPESSQIGKNE